MPTQAQPTTYHQTHHVHGLPACPLCGWKSLIVRSFGPRPVRKFYVTCDHCASDPLENAGMIEGPIKESAEEAGKAFNIAMQKYSRSFCDGADGVYDS